jgi:hypothetical protein
MRALWTPAKFAEVFEAVDSCTVVVAELKMQGVLSDELNLSKLETIGDVNRKDHALPGHLVLTRGARTKPAKKRSQMPRLMAIRPENLDFAGIELLDFRRSRGV